MALSEKQLKAWKEANKNAVDEGFDTYINSRGLEIIKNAEGEPVDGTNHYGITQNGIDGLERLTVKYGVKVPDWVIGAKADKLTESQCRTIAGYNAALNTYLVDTFSKCDNFSKMPLDTRSMFLTYLHNENPYQLRKSFAKGMPGSFLRAVQTGNPYEIGVSILSNADGTPVPEATDPSVGGFSRRKMIALMGLGNKKFTLNVDQERELDRRLKQPGFIKESHQRARRLANDWYVPRAIIADRFDNPMAWLKSSPNMQDAEKQEKEKEDNQNGKNVLAYLTKPIKKLFTNSEDNANAATRNTNDNLQQGA